jgi:hypothetical protein
VALDVAAHAIHLRRQSLDDAGCRLMPVVVGSPFGSPNLISAANVHSTGTDWDAGVARRWPSSGRPPIRSVCPRDRSAPAAIVARSDRLWRHPPTTKAKGCPYAALCAPHLARSKLGHAERMFRAKVRAGPCSLLVMVACLLPDCFGEGRHRLGVARGSGHVPGDELNAWQVAGAGQQRRRGGPGVVQGAVQRHIRAK